MQLFTTSLTPLFTMFTYFATAITVAAAVFATASPEMASAFLEWCFNSLGLAGSVQSFDLHPSEIYNHYTTEDTTAHLTFFVFVALPNLFCVFWYLHLCHLDDIIDASLALKAADESSMIPPPTESNPLANLITIYDSSKRDHPQRFRVGVGMRRSLPSAKCIRRVST